MSLQSSNSYVFGRDGILTCFDISLEPPQWKWSSVPILETDGGNQEDRAVIDIQWNNEYVVIVTGSKLTVFSAESTTSEDHPWLWQAENEKYAPNVEAFSRLTLAGNSVFVNKLRQHQFTPQCTEIQRYELGAEPPLTWTYLLDGVLALQEMLLAEDELFVSSVDGRLIVVKVDPNDNGSCSNPGPSGDDDETIEGCGSWRCFQSNLT